MKSVRIAFTFLIILTSYFGSLESFDKVIIWGHKLHSHTHSYIHNAFYLTFKHLGYDTYWFDNEDDVSNFDFSNSLFLTEAQVDQNIPLRQDCLYMLHNCSKVKYQSLPIKNRIFFQVYTNDVLKFPTITKIDKFIYYDIPGRCVYMPWGTDLLPYQIDKIKRKLRISRERDKKIYWVGTIGSGKFGNIDQLTPFIKACSESGIEFVDAGMTRHSVEDNLRFIQQSYMAPALVGKWQKEVGYIPCRIFKNISYGQFGVTNSREVYELFDGKVVYNSDEYQLFYDAEKRLKKLTLSQLFELMDIVKTKHTYINRIQTLLDFFEIANEAE